MPSKKAKLAWAIAEWGVECPYCGNEQVGDEEAVNEKQQCENCKKWFIVPEEVGDITQI